MGSFWAKSVRVSVANLNQVLDFLLVVCVDNILIVVELRPSHPVTRIKPIEQERERDP